MPKRERLYRVRLIEITDTDVYATNRKEAAEKAWDWHLNEDTTPTENRTEFPRTPAE